MKIMPSIILTNAINAPKITGVYSQFDITEGAKLILELGGTIQPLIVRRAGMNDCMPIYDLVSGEFVYLCAAEARRIDSVKGESIDAYILTKDNEPAIMRQLMMLQNCQ